tara:strand:- start:525 stop:782 length:258 start_codon:yes stop_codon:yes gene_type:complete
MHDDDEIIIPCAPEDYDFVDDIFSCGTFKGSKQSCENYLSFIENAERVGLDPENTLEELKGLSVTCINYYKRALKKVKEKIEDEY